MKQLDPKYVWKNLALGVIIFSFFFLLLLGFVVLLLSSDGSLQAIYWAVLFLFTVFLFLNFVTWLIVKLSYHFYRYELKEEGFRKESGIIWKSYTTIPYNRIQNVDIYRGLLDRIFGLSRLHIQTAGFSNLYSITEGRLPGLSVETAEQLRDELIKRVSRLKSSGGV